MTPVEESSFNSLPFTSGRMAPEGAKVNKKLAEKRQEPYAFGPVKVFLQLSLGFRCSRSSLHILTTHPYFDNIKFEIFDTGCPQCLSITSVPCARRFPYVHWHLGANFLLVLLFLPLFHWWCCNHSVGVALNAQFTMNGMHAKNNTIYKWRKQAIIEWLRHMISIVACCHSVKLCALAAFWSQQNGAVTMMWRSCCVKPSQKERAIGAVCCKKEGMLLQPLCWCYIECVIHHKRDVREEQHHIYVAL